MPEAVIVATARSPIGRAYKGSLIEVRADDLAAHAINAVMEKVPEVERASVNDVMVGCGLTHAEQGFNLARPASLLAAMPDTVPATTVNRFCASSLQTIRMAFHAIKAGEGDFSPIRLRLWRNSRSLRSLGNSRSLRSLGGQLASDL